MSETAYFLSETAYFFLTASFVMMECRNRAAIQMVMSGNSPEDGIKFLEQKNQN